MMQLVPFFQGGACAKEIHSPIFFLLYVLKVFRLLFKREESKGDLHDIKICRSVPIVSHLLFADDSFLFFKANDKEVIVMKKCFMIMSLLLVKLLIYISLRFLSAIM